MSQTAGTVVGTVYLVGGGPGAPGLLTARAAQVLASADVVVYDRLISPRLLSMASSTADFVYVGKEAGHHTMKQDAINVLLTESALQGKQVVRLKGGDPFVFGRGGEEAEACRRADIPFEVVPGITSPVAVSAYAGIPVTHRGVSTSFTVITGHQCEACANGDVNWASLGTGTGTLVILMGVGQLDRITQYLLSIGRKADTPVALIRWGTRADQDILIGSLEDISQRATQASFQPPAIIVVGDVVNLRSTLKWFEQKPLSGRRVLVASDTKAQGRQMAESLEALGAETVDVSVEQGTLVDCIKVQQMLSRPNSVGASLVFHTVQAVHQFFAAFKVLSFDLRALAKYQFGARNKEVAHALKVHGVIADSVGETEHSESVGADNWKDTALLTDVEQFCGGYLAGTYELCSYQVDTPQLRAISRACETPFEVCWSTSTEALAFIQRLQTVTSKALVGHDVTCIQAPTVDAFCSTLLGDFERHTMVASR